MLLRNAVTSFQLYYSLLILLYPRIMTIACLLAINQLGISGILATGRTWIKLKKEWNHEDIGFFQVNVPNSVLCHSYCSRSSCWYMYKVIICCLYAPSCFEGNLHSEYIEIVKNWSFRKFVLDIYLVVFIFKVDFEEASLCPGCITRLSVYRIASFSQYVMTLQWVSTTTAPKLRLFFQTIFWSDKSIRENKRKINEDLFRPSKSKHHFINQLMNW